MENSFQTIDGKNMVYSKLFFLKYLEEYDMPSCRYGNGEMVNGDVYEKCTLSPCTY